MNAISVHEGRIFDAIYATIVGVGGVVLVKGLEWRC